VTVIEVPRSEQVKETRFVEIPNHQIFRGEIGGYTNRLFVKVDARIYPLDVEPAGALYDFWNSVSITNYQPVQHIHVTVEALK
jgi:hypothetical protein